MANIPRKTKAVDGVSTVPGRALVRSIDWVSLKREFILQNDYPRAMTWLAKAKGWSRKQIENGNTQDNIVGWSRERAAFQQEKTQQALAEALEEERKLLPQLRRAKAQLVLEAIKGVGGWRHMEAAQQRVMYQILKTELGEPISIKVQGIVSARDPAEVLLEAYGLMKDGELILDGAYDNNDRKVVDAVDQSDSGQASATSSSTPAEIPRG